MSGYSLDANILIDTLLGHAPAFATLSALEAAGERIWISRMAWVEALSKGDEVVIATAIRFLSRFGIDEMDEGIASRAAALRRQRPKLKSPDAIILASAQAHGRVLVTRNTRDFPQDMPGIHVPYTI